MMRNKDKIIDTLFYIIMGTLYTFSVSSAFFSASALFISPQTLLILSVVFVLMFSVIIYNKYTVMIFLGLLILGAVVLLFVGLSENIEAEWFESLKKLVVDMYLFARKKVPYRKEFDFPSAFLITLFISFFSVLCTQVHFTFFAMSLFAITVFFIPTTSGSDRLGISFFLIVFCLVIFLIKRLNMYAEGKTDERSGLGGHRMNTVMVLVFGVAAFFSSWYLPKPHIESIDIIATVRNTNYKELAERILENLNLKTVKPISFSNQSGELGGPIKLNDDPIMSVTAEERTFLSGKIYDTYTGKGWVVNDTDKEVVEKDEDGVYDLLPYKSGINEFANGDVYGFNEIYIESTIGDIWGKEIDQILESLNEQGMDVASNTIIGQEIFSRQTITIDMMENRTKTVFKPTIPETFSLDSENNRFVLQIDDLGQLSSKNTLPVNSIYSFDYYEVSGIPNVNSFVPPNLQNFSEIEDKSDFERYLQLPDDLPQRVQDLAKELTAGYDSDYAKIQALSDYLKMFPYTLSPGKVPSNSDLVDHFLFAEQRGYCVYYASSLAMMGRTLGIPTRYVEGYVMPREKQSDGKYTVTNKQSHAWTEVYIEPIGWIAFDPTAPDYSIIRDSVVVGSGDGDVKVNEEILKPQIQQDYINSTTSQQNIEESSSQSDQAQDRYTPPEPEINVQNEENDNEVSFFLILFVITMIVVPIVMFLYRKQLGYYIYKIRFNNYKKKSHKMAVNNIFGAILKQTARIGYPIMPNETALAYAERVNEYLSFNDIETDMEDTVSIFSKSAYSGQEVSGEEIDILSDYFFRLIFIRSRLRK